MELAARSGAPVTARLGSSERARSRPRATQVRADLRRAALSAATAPLGRETGGVAGGKRQYTRALSAGLGGDGEPLPGSEAPRPARLGVASRPSAPIPRGSSASSTKAQDRPSPDTSCLSEFLSELDREIEWQWKWEKLNRTRQDRLQLAIWGTQILLMSLAVFQVSTYGRGDLWVIGAIAFLSVANLGLPLLGTSMRFQQRQEVYDRHARTYSAIRVELTSGQIDLPEAVRRFKRVRVQPTEAVIRRTP